MARIAGIDLPKNKRGEIGLTYIYGIGRSTARYILEKANVDLDKKVNDWNDEEQTAIRNIITNEFKTEKEILVHKPQLFISGHSHILKIMYDDKLNCLHINPGAAGKHGWHKMRTVVRFAIDAKNILDCEVIELGTRG